MRYSTASGLMMAALIGEAVAGPAHVHLHQRVHQKKDVDWESLDWANMGIDWTSAYEAGKASKTAAPVAVATAAATVAAAVAPAATTTAAAASDAVSASAVFSDISDTLSDAVADLLDGLYAASNDATTFGSVVTASGSLGDHYRGNFGSPYGSNVIKVSSTSGYDFTNTFVNTSPDTIVVNIWNKVGPDHQDLSGSALAPKNTTLTFALKPGKSQIVAFQENSQIGWCQASKNYAASGAYAEGWGEANFVPTGSGYDYSAIMSSGGNNYDMTITCEEVTCVSSRTENYWLTDTQPIGDSNGSCYVPQSTMHLTTKMGGKVSV